MKVELTKIGFKLIAETKEESNLLEEYFEDNISPERLVTEDKNKNRILYLEFY